mmetsp:Transcript_51552/g.85482  ORF Transcript_51552/g.85482 Transcript_51552/m.85482 type:complete len:295 (+) Transcript_51552:58-942(+)
MLFADKRALETNLQVSLLKIREKELQFYTQNCIAIGTQAALLSGFAYNGIIQVDIPTESSNWLKTMYLCVTTAAMGFELIAVLNSTLCSMLGPGLALRGPDGSMHRAVDGLMLEYRLTFLFFTAGLVAFHVSALLFAWLEFSWPVALAMTLALLMFIYGMYRYWLRIYSRFALSSDRMITGKFEFGQPAGAAASSEAHDRADQTSADASDQKVGLTDILSGGISSIPANSKGSASLKRTQEAETIIGLVEPKATPIGGSGIGSGFPSAALPYSGAQPPYDKTSAEQRPDKCVMQ